MLAVLDPILNATQRQDIVQVLHRTGDSAEQWQNDVLDVLPRRFGVQGWTQPVESNVQRFAQALNGATALDARLRQHIQRRIGGLFTSNKPVELSTLQDVMKAWCSAHSIPAENDLSDAARTLLELLEGTELETLLTHALPRALPAIGLPYQSWPSIATLDNYVAVVAGAVREIEAYTPLAEPVAAWLRGLVVDVLDRRLPSEPREQRRFAEIAARELRAWQRDLSLPAFSPTLTASDLDTLHADAPTWQSTAMLVLLRDSAATDPATLVLVDLPAALGEITAAHHWNLAQATTLIERFRHVQTALCDLPAALSDQLCGEIAPVFGGNGCAASPAALLRHMREWRSQYVVLPNQPLTADAKLLLDVLQSADTPDELVLQRLPGRMTTLRTPFPRWESWQQRADYRNAFETVAREIERIGTVGEASSDALALWTDLQSRMKHLHSDDQRWLIKMFNDEFHA